MIELPPLPKAALTGLRIEGQPPYQRFTADQLRSYGLSCARAAMKWQPIETAPKDGTDIIVMYVHIETQVVHAAFWLQAGLADDSGWWSYDKSEVSRVKLDGWMTPTHWMPLPEPPQ